MLDSRPRMVSLQPVEFPASGMTVGLRREAGGVLRDRVRRCPRNCKRRAAVPFRVTGRPQGTREGRSRRDDPQARRPAFGAITFLGRGFLRWIALVARTRSLCPGAACHGAFFLRPLHPAKQVIGRCFQSSSPGKLRANASARRVDGSDPRLTRRAPTHPSSRMS
jgi:hypothetical protein